MSAPESSVRFHRPQVLLLIVVFLAIGVAVFGRTVTYDFMNFDDDLLVTNNPLVLHPSVYAVRQAFSSYDPELYVPLTILSYQVTTATVGLHPGVFHLVNVLLHIASALLVVRFLFLLTRRRSLAVAAGLLFLVHPVTVEGVAWIAGRKDVLATFFAVAALAAYASWIQSEKRQTRIISLFLFLLAILSKPSVLTLPLVFVLIDRVKRRTPFLSAIVRQWPSFLLSLAFGIVALVGKRSAGPGGLTDAALLAGNATLLTLKNLVFPLHLSVLYPFDGPVTFFNPSVAVATIAAVVWLLILALQCRRYPWLTFYLASAIILFIPGLFNMHKDGGPYLTSDRYVVLPLVFLAGGAMQWWFRFSERRTVRSSLKLGFIGAVIVLFATVSFLRTSVWRDGITLFTDALRLSPTSVLALNNRSNVEAANGQVMAAYLDLQRAIELSPNAPILRTNIAGLLLVLGRREEAFREMETAIAIDPKRPETYYAIARLHRTLGDEAKAKAALRIVYDLAPEFLYRKLDIAGWKGDEDGKAEKDNEGREVPPIALPSSSPSG